MPDVMDKATFRAFLEGKGKTFSEKKYNSYLNKIAALAAADSDTASEQETPKRKSKNKKIEKRNKEPVAHTKRVKETLKTMRYEDDDAEKEGVASLTAAQELEQASAWEVRRRIFRTL